MQSPAVPAHRYVKIDVGAGTTNVSYFTIREAFNPEADSWKKQSDRLTFFGAASVPHGMDGIDAALATEMGEPETMLSVRGFEDRFLPPSPPSRRLARLHSSAPTLDAVPLGSMRSQSSEAPLRRVVGGTNAVLSSLEVGPMSQPFGNILAPANHAGCTCSREPSASDGPGTRGAGYCAAQRGFPSWLWPMA